MDDFVLEFREVSKLFPGVVALDKVSFGVKRGAVHVLMGENGAGKSTLMKIISGEHEVTSGEILLDGEKVEFKNPQMAREKGIAMIYQELQYVPEFTVEEFLMMGREPGRKANCFIDWKELHRAAADILKQEGLRYDLKTKIKDLSVSDIQLLEITRAISTQARIIIMDEPTSALSNAEVERLFENIRRMKERGITVLYISHKMDEVFRIGDEMTVMRDGKHIATDGIANYDYDKVVRLMVGREISSVYPKEQAEIGDVVLEVKGLTSAMLKVDHVSFQVRRGEILGIAGLMGAGRTELVSMIAGLEKYDEGEIWVEGKPVQIHSVAGAIRNGIMMATEDRRRQGIISCRSIKENISLPNLRRLSRFLFVDQKKENQAVDLIWKRLRIKAPSKQTLVSNLSGGNQQKVVLAKWLLSEPKVLILDEPTRGIDVAAKHEIYKLMNEMVREGIAIIMISSELPEFIGMCDRAYTMYEGRFTGELQRSQLTQEKIMKLATGVSKYEKG